MLLFGPGCTPPDRPGKLSGPLPSVLLENLAPEVNRQFRVAPGVWYHYLWSKEGPWGVHLLEADLSRCDIALSTLAAGDPPAGTDAREAVSALVARTRGVLAAVNGDFFTPEGRPLGWEVVEGIVLSRGRRPAMAWRAGTPPWMGAPLRVDGEDWVGAEVAREPADRSLSVVGGFPLLLSDGQRVTDLGTEDRPAFAARRHPRTAVGFDVGEERLWLVVVDGRQEGYSDGMSLPELADLLGWLGATDALNLDGGGSTVMVIGDHPVSSPSDREGERPVANAVAVRRVTDGCGP